MKKYIWIILGLSTLGLNFLFGVLPWIYEHVYFRGIFQVIRLVYDYLLGWLPFPMIYVLFFVVVHLMYTILRFKGVRKANSIKEKFRSVLLPIFSLIGAIIFFFYVLWGFNYKQENLATTLNLPQMKEDSIGLYEESLFFMSELNYLRNQISTDTIPLSFDDLPESLEADIRKNLESLLTSWDLPTLGRVRVRKLYPKGTLLRISTAGVYIPYVFEGHIDAGLHPIQQPFTMAHEMSHGYGLADEGTCNFTGYLACMQSENYMMQYSATMSLWQYMVINLRRSSPELYRMVLKQMDNRVRIDMNAISEQMNKYPDILPEIRDVVYDTYLKSNGIPDGMYNYSTVVRMLLSWKNSNLNPELRNKIYTRKVEPKKE